MFPTPDYYNSIVAEKDDQVKLNDKVYNGFYISYNSYDTATYGDVTTALVLGQMQEFYILNGNHCEQYRNIAEQDFFACLEYFKNHADQINKFSTVTGKGVNNG